mmetsp:Transcript_11479/g.16978  ORF Transcript_11479/g.16978 Transcript_11479/m.16978 type:complete len:922 (+) Transcript_11479:98-2863(+)
MSQLHFDQNVENEIFQVLQPFVMQGQKNSNVLADCRKKLGAMEEREPNFANYLALIYSRPFPPQLHESQLKMLLSLKQLSGIKLQNILKKKELNRDQLEHIKYCAITGLNSNQDQVSRTAASIISSFIKKNGLDAFSNLFDILNEKATNAPNSLASFWCMNVIVNDLTNVLIEHPSKPVLKIISICYNFVENFGETPNVEILNEIAEILKTLVKSDKHDLFAGENEIHRFMNSLDIMMRIREPTLDENISSMIDILIPYPEIIQGKLDSLCGYLLNVVKGGHEQSGLKACSCLLMMFTKDNLADLRKVLYERNFLSFLMPTIVDAMLLNELAIQTLEAEEEEQIHPSRLNHKPELHGVQPGQASYVENYTGDDSDSDSDDDFDVDVLENWSLSKCAQQTYSKIVACFPEEAIRLSASAIDESIRHQYWVRQYRGLLMLGILSSHYQLDITHKLFLNNLNIVLSKLQFDNPPLVIMNACWSLSEFCPTLSKMEVFPHMMNSLISLLKHPSNRVQIGALTALYNIGEMMKDILFHNDFYPNLMHAISEGLVSYHKKTLLNLYDLLDMMLDNIEKNIRNHPFLNDILGMLIAHGKTRNRSSSSIMHYFFIMKKIVKYAGDHITPFAPDIYQLSMQCVWYKISEYDEYMKNQKSMEPPITAPLTVSLMCVNEIFASLSYAPNDKLDSIICDRNASFYDALFKCMQHDEGPVRQTVFGIIGDLAKFKVPSFARIEPKVYLEVLIGVLDHIVNCSIQQPTAASNAAWAIGEIALLIRDNINHYMSSILQFLIPIMNNQDALPNLRENCAVTIGRLAIVSPKTVSGWFSSFIMSYSILIIEAKDPDERDQSYRGLLLVIQNHQNQADISQALVFIINALVRYDSGSLVDDVNNMLLSIRRAYDSQTWNKLIQNFSKDPQMVNYLSNLN